MQVVYCRKLNKLCINFQEIKMELSQKIKKKNQFTIEEATSCISGYSASFHKGKHLRHIAIGLLLKVPKATLALMGTIMRKIDCYMNP